MRFFPRDIGKKAFFKENPSQGVENRGSLISVPLALREKNFRAKIRSAEDVPP